MTYSVNVPVFTCLSLIGIGGLVCLSGGTVASPTYQGCGQVAKNLSYKHPIVLSQQDTEGFSQDPNRQRMSNAGSRCPPGMYTPEGKIALNLAPLDGMSYTLAEHPTFYIYFPFQSVSTLEFKLYTDAGKTLLYKAPIALGRQRGILALQLPANAPALQPDQNYQWVFKWSGDETVVLVGKIRRVVPTGLLNSQLQRSSERTKPGIYAQSGLWQDALTSLVGLRLSQPDNPTIQADWLALLAQVKLQDLVNEPIVPLQVQQK